MRSSQRDVVEELRRRAFLLIEVRWWLTLFLFLGVGATYLAGSIQLSVTLVRIAALMLLTNICYQAVRSRLRRSHAPRASTMRLFILVQIILDIHIFLTAFSLPGDVGSPLEVVVVSYVVFIALLLSPVPSLLIFALGCAGVALLAAAGLIDVNPDIGLILDGGDVRAGQETVRARSVIVAFSIVLSLASLTTAAISQSQSRRDASSREQRHAVSGWADLFDRLHGICNDLREESTLDALREWVGRFRALAAVRGVVVSVLDDDGATLCPVAERGLSESSLCTGPLDSRRSPILVRVLEGHPVALGRATAHELVQLGARRGDLGAAVSIASIVIYPIRAGDRVVGALWAFSDRPDRFGDGDLALCASAADALGPSICSLFGGARRQLERNLAAPVMCSRDLPSSLDRAPDGP